MLAEPRAVHHRVFRCQRFGGDAVGELRQVSGRGWPAADRGEPRRAPPGTTNAPSGTVTATAPAVPDPGVDTSGLAGISYPPGAVLSDLGPNQKRYEVTGMTLAQVQKFFEDQLIAAGYTRAAEASASRFYDKGTKRIQVTWSDQSGTIRGVVRVTRS